MEKLVELVYYYNSHLEKGIIGIGLTTSIKEDGREVHFDKEKEIRKYENYIISKKYGFIERLVENDKIDMVKKTDNGLEFNWEIMDDCINTFDAYPVDMNTGEICDDCTDMLIMILAIQDNPIEYLCSILNE